MNGDGPRPYVPPDLQRRMRYVEQSDENDLKPWQRRRSGETESERLDRVYHSCFRCGHHEDDLAVLNAHETECRSAGDDTD